MVARLQFLQVLLPIEDSDSEPDTAETSGNPLSPVEASEPALQESEQSSGTLATPNAAPRVSEKALAEPLVSQVNPLAQEISEHTIESPAAAHPEPCPEVWGYEDSAVHTMPRKRVPALPPDCASGNAAGAQDECVFPVETKAGFSQALKPIGRKQNFRAVARFKRDAPVLVCVEKIQQTKRVLGLTDQEIAELVGVSRPTIRAALRCDPSVNLYTFCAMLNVLGLDVAEVFPMRRKKAVNAPTWQRGQHHSDESLRDAIEELHERKRKPFWR